MTDTVHAGAVALGERGLLIRGEAGTGKSDLARALLARWTLGGRYAALVSDDRSTLHPAGGRLIAAPAVTLAGLTEIRNAGIFRGNHLPAVVLHLVVDLAAEPPRIPEATENTAVLHGIRLPRVTLPQRMTARNVDALWWVIHAARVDGLASDPTTCAGE